MHDIPSVTEVLISLAQTAPATFVLAFVAYRLDQRIATLTEKIDGTLNKLADAALAAVEVK